MQQILFEIGGSVAAWPTSKHFCAWLALAPRHEISGGKVLRQRVPKTGQSGWPGFPAGRADAAAQPSIRPWAPTVGACAPATAPNAPIVATAHKLARIFYTMLKERIPFDTTRDAGR